MLDDTDKQLTAVEEHRKESFKVEIGPRTFRGDADSEYSLSVTHNGWQWQSITMNLEELQELSVKLSVFLHLTLAEKENEDHS